MTLFIDQFQNLIQTVKKDVEDTANCREKKLLKVESPVKCPIEKDGNCVENIIY